MPLVGSFKQVGKDSSLEFHHINGGKVQNPPYAMVPLLGYTGGSRPLAGLVLDHIITGIADQLAGMTN